MCHKSDHKSVRNEKEILGIFRNKGVRTWEFSNVQVDTVTRTVRSNLAHFIVVNVYPKFH